MSLNANQPEWHDHLASRLCPSLACLHWSVHKRPGWKADRHGEGPQCTEGSYERPAMPLTVFGIPPGAPNPKSSSLQLRSMSEPGLPAILDAAEGPTSQSGQRIQILAWYKGTKWE